MIEVQEYIDSLGRNGFRRWFGALDGLVQTRILQSVERLRNGNLSAIKGLGAGLFELRLNFGPGHRVYCGRDGERLIILLGGGAKSRQQEDIDSARILWQEYKSRKKAISIR